jgi:transcriptional regulator with XRE-family HTH domain
MTVTAFDTAHRLRALVETGEARRLRESAGLSLRAMARGCGDVDPSAIGLWERGMRWPTGRRLRDYTRALDRLAALDAQAGGGDAPA